MSKLLNSIVGNKLRRVVYYYWHNVSTGENTSLDWVEFTDHEQNIFTLQRSEDDDNIKLIDFDLEKEKAKLHSQFAGAFTIERYNATLDKFWFPILDSEIVSIKQGSDNSIIIDFGDDHKVELFLDEDGIGIEFYE